MLKRDYKMEKLYEGIFFTEEFTVGEDLATKVKVIFTVLNNKCYISLSSGTKRKHLDIYEDKGVKNKGCGINLLVKVKSIIKDFIADYRSYARQAPFKCIEVGWSDKRRRDIYNRGLSDLGFRFHVDREFGKVLRLSLK